MDSVDAYNKVCKQDQPFRAYDLVNALERKKLNIPDWHFSGVLAQDFFPFARSNIQQVLLRSARRKIMKPLILFCAGDNVSKAIPFPHQWLKILKDKKVPLDGRRSKILFFKEQLRGWFRALRIFKSLIACSLKSYNSPDYAYDMYPDLSKNACIADQQQYNFVNWLFAKEEWTKQNNLHVTSRQLFETSHVNCHRNIFPRLSISSSVLFFFETMFLFVFCGLKWLCGAWSLPFLMPDLIQFLYFKRIKNPAQRYGFNNSSFAIRPLWTYFAEKKGADVFLYFYSSNSNLFYFNQKEDAPVSPGYISMSWSKYWVMGNNFKTFLVDQCGVQGDIIDQGCIDFTDSCDAVPEFDVPTISLFDIPLYNRSYFADLGLIAPFYTPEIINQFIDDVIYVAKSEGYKVLWKVKRDISENKNVSAYKNIIDRYRSDSDVIMVSPDVSARRLIEKTDISISIPYTSTALVAKESQKQFCYYDPTQKLTYFKGLSYDVPVIQGRDDLGQFLKKGECKKPCVG